MNKLAIRLVVERERTHVFAVRLAHLVELFADLAHELEATLLVDGAARVHGGRGAEVGALDEVRGSITPSAFNVYRR